MDKKKEIAAPTANKLVYQESSWNLDSSYQFCMDEVSRRINGGSYATQAVAEVVGADLERLRLTDGSKDIPLPSDDLQQEVMTSHALPAIGVNYLLTELNDIMYDMQRKRSQYKGSAYNYVTAIDAVSMFVGISKAEQTLKEKRMTLVKARLTIPKTMEEPRLRVMNPGTYRWLFLTRPDSSSLGERRTNVWCVRPSLKRRITDFATDFGIGFGTLAEMLMVIAWEDFQLLDPYYLIKLEKETKNIWRWFEMFRAEEEPQ